MVSSDVVPDHRLRVAPGGAPQREAAGDRRRHGSVLRLAGNLRKPLEKHSFPPSASHAGNKGPGRSPVALLGIIPRTDDTILGFLVFLTTRG